MTLHRAVGRAAWRPSRALLHGARDGLSGAAAAGCAAYGAWSWIHGPRPRLPLDPERVRKVLVIRVDLLGDLVFSLPSLSALRAAFPSARIDALVLPYTAGILEAAGVIDRIHELDVNRYRRPRRPDELLDLVSRIRALRAERYDLAVNFSGLVGGLLTVASGAAIRLGHAGDSYSGCFNIAVRGHRYDRAVHEVEYQLDLLRAAGIRAPYAWPALPRTGDRTPRAANSPVSPVLGLPSQPYAVIVPGASNGSAKRWPPRHWAAVGDTLAAERDLPVVLVGGAAERSLADEVAAAMRAPVTNLAGSTTLAELREVLSGAAIVLAGDTGPLHLAAALGRPVVGVYGPTDPTNTGPLGAAAGVVRLGLACSPCYDLRTPANCKLPDRSTACMEALDPARVMASVAAVLEKLAPPPSAIGGSASPPARESASPASAAEGPERG